LNPGIAASVLSGRRAGRTASESIPDAKGIAAVGCVVAPAGFAIAASVPRKSSPESGLSDPALRGEFSGLSAVAVGSLTS